MALSAVSAAEMKTFFQENRVPENVITWLQDLCMIESMADIVGYFGPRASYEKTIEKSPQQQFERQIWQQ